MKAIAKKHLGIPLEQVNNSVLVVNTDSHERLSLIETLRHEGFNAMPAVDPEDGLNQALLYQPSLIITAKEMPFADGFAFFTTLQGVPETRRIPVILLSAGASSEEEALAFKRGFFDYIPMPVKDITLAARVGRAIAAGRAYTPHRRDQTTLSL
jgi:PleD family two-component response regulator